MNGRMICGGLLLLSVAIMPGCVVFEIRDELKKANENLATANTQLMVANTELDIANAKLLEANARLAEANQDLSVVNTQLATTIQKLDGTNGQMATLQNKHLSNLDNQLNPLGKSLSEVDVHLGSLRKTLDNIDSMIPFIGLTDSGPEDTTSPGPTVPADGSTTTPAPSTSPTAAPAGGSTTGTATPAKPAEKSARMLPETVQIDGREFKLSAYLWRNFQPTVGQAPDAKGLLAKLSLMPTDKGAAPRNVEAVAVRLQRGKNIWTGNAAKESGDTPQTWERMIRPGPAWDIGPGVNIYVQLLLPDGSKTWIAAYGQTIERVD